MSAHSVLAPAGAQAARIHAHWLLLWYVCLAVYIIVGGFYLWVLIRSRRRRPEAPADRTHQVDRGLGKYVAVATGITAATLVLLLIAAAVTGRDLSAYAPKPDLRVDVIGHQWWWEVHYLNDDPSKMIATANEIHIPTGRKVTLRLTSEDVIHSFWAPSLNGKRDLIPGRMNELVIEADRPGIYRGQCAEYCGLQHAHMAFNVIALGPGDFSAWMRSELKPAAEPSDPVARRGRDVFMGAPCVLCHAIRGTPAQATNGPDLTHIASRRTIGAGTLPNTPGHLAGWIQDPQSIKPGNNMPVIPLDAADLQPLLTYLETLK